MVRRDRKLMGGGWKALFIAVLLLGNAGAARAGPPSPSAAYGLTSRVVPKPYLRMPQTAAGKIPALLSQTGVFKDTRNLVPGDGLIPYDLVVSFWSDGASKQRWVSLPKEK